ncbi:MAG TPA: hypothetical protein EYP65_06920 [Armatimonadetes bacterium]|nr:hypothetical protein [Armatimonadota bacterium]
MNARYTVWCILFVLMAQASIGAKANLTTLLNGFENRDELMPIWRKDLKRYAGRWRPQGTKLQQSTRYVTQGMYSACVAFTQLGARWAGLACYPKIDDWSEYHTFAFDAYWAGSQPLTLRLRLDDAQGRKAWLSFHLKPKTLARLRLNLADVGRQIDLRQVTLLYLSGSRPERGRGTEATNATSTHLTG